jgi:hypothetical protein
MSCFSENKSKTEKGSAIIYIFIAIALFAALAFTVSRSLSGGSSPSKNKELDQLRASEILQFSRNLRTAIQTMKIGGVNDDEISFENPYVAGYTNTLCADDRCKVFHPRGGGLSWQSAAEEALSGTFSSAPTFGEWHFSGANPVLYVGTPKNTACISASCAELIAYLPFLKKDVCQQINYMLGMQETELSPPPVDDTDGPDFSAAGAAPPKFSDGGTLYGTGDELDPAELERQLQYCYEEEPNSGIYVYYQVLLSR